MNEHALILEGIEKRFGAVHALNNASLTVRRGSFHAVLGENGAGKTTLMRTVYGMVAPDAGLIRIDGTSVTFRSSADAIRHGVGMVHQHFTLVPAMTVAENLALGGRGWLRRTAIEARVAELSQQTGLPVDPHARIATLGVGAQQRAEILKALFAGARLLILDEPTAVLTPREASELFTWLRRFVADGGTVVLVTHKLHEALALADDVTVLRRGAVALRASTKRVDADSLVRALTGDAAGATHRIEKTPTTAGDTVAALSHVSVRDARGVVRLQDVTVSCRAGEIMGVAGIEGSGVHEFLRVLAGRLAPSTGAVTLPAMVGFVPEDRLRDAFIESFTLTENAALRGAGARRGAMRWPALAGETVRLMERHDVRAPSPYVRGGALSGGNQQKFVVGRELDARPAMLVAENPVRGLDILATAHVMRELADAAATGRAVVLYSADIDELLPLADRMLVVFNGRVREVPVERDAVAAALVGAA